MLPALWIVVRTYAPYITFPVAAVIGVIGYNMEGLVRNRNTTPSRLKSVEEEREERQLEDLVVSKDCTQVDSLKDRKFIPRSVLDRNLSPSLAKHE